MSIAGRCQHPQVFSLDALQSLPQIERTIDIHCVTRWSKLGVRFRGVSLAQLLELVVPDSRAKFVSFVALSERRHSTSLPLATALELETLVVLAADRAPLAVEHGGPVRVVVPGRYFYKSLKWLAEIELLPEDRLGFWEANSGYHNEADPWRQQRYVPGRYTPADARRILATRDVHGQDLLGLPAAGLELAGLDARGALLRDVDFRGCDLTGANFDGANLTNAHFEGADLRGASFRGADLEGASFQRADLRGAVLLAASMFATSYCDELTGSTESSARIDASTAFDVELFEHLTPLQADCVRRRITETTSAP